MKDILHLTVQLRNKSYAIGEEIAKLLGIKSHEMPIGVFPMIFNLSTLLLELLSHYLDVWGKVSTTIHSSVEEAKKENADRVILIQKMAFIQTMSSVEFCCKYYIRTHPKKIGRINGRVYLIKIMDRSKKHGVISKPDFNLWEGVNELRNALVHNNGISEKTKEYGFPKCKLELNKNKMIRGNMKSFPFITDWLLDAIKSWIIEIEKK